MAGVGQAPQAKFFWAYQTGLVWFPVHCFSRISSPIPPSGEKEWNVPNLTIGKIKYSLAPRHQAFIHGDPIDPHHIWRRVAFHASQYLPAADAPPTAQYGPLVTLAKDGKFPHSEIPVPLVHFLIDEKSAHQKENTRPKNVP